MRNNGFLTIAYGAKRYLDMARSLIQSYRYFGGTWPFAVVTDQPASPLLKDFTHKIPIDHGYGRGLAQKLHVDLYSPFQETFFVDSDGLFYKGPNQLWDMYVGDQCFGIRAFRYRSAKDGVPGLSNPARTFEMLGIQETPFLNSGLFYFNATPDGKDFFELARSLSRQHAELGLKPKEGNLFNDEDVFSLAMSVKGIKPLPWEEGRAMDMYSYVTKAQKLNIANACAEFHTYGRKVDPVFVHYCAGAQSSYTYFRERARLRRLVNETAPAYRLLPSELEGLIQYYSATAQRKIRKLKGYTLEY